MIIMENRSQLKDEAVKRMNILKIFKPAVEEFSKRSQLNESEGIGNLYWINEMEQEIVDAFENEYGYLVYHVLHNKGEGIDETYSLLYVSSHKEEWENDRRDLAERCPVAYVVNIDCPSDSEFGRIGIKPNIGGIIRTA